jgi:cobalamin biosynthetic protein CobC
MYKPSKYAPTANIEASKTSKPLKYKEFNHGGRLEDAIKLYGIEGSQWLDLSAALNPNPWPMLSIPPEVLHRLPQPDDGLLEAAQAYYQCENLLPLSGSQAAIQALPRLRSRSNVWVLDNTYSEHLEAWQSQGHNVRQVQWQDIDNLMCLQPVDVIVLVNPDNPSGQLIPPELLIKWAKRLAKKKGWLIVDEAFMDATNEYSLMPDQCSDGSTQDSLIVLRSVGKFFGLAGVRLGFIKAPARILQSLCNHLGPWAVSHIARWIGKQALQDTLWIDQQRLMLEAESLRLNTLLKKQFSLPVAGCALFQSLQHPQAEMIYTPLAQQGILVRYYPHQKRLRFALPGTPAQWIKLEQGLARCSSLY